MVMECIGLSLLSLLAVLALAGRGSGSNFFMPSRCAGKPFCDHLDEALEPRPGKAPAAAIRQPARAPPDDRLRSGLRHARVRPVLVALLSTQMSVHDATAITLVSDFTRGRLYACP